MAPKVARRPDREAGVSANTEPRPSGSIPDDGRAKLLTTIALAGAAFGIAALAESGATASPDNCGELPGIAMTMTMLLGLGIALVIAVLGGVGAAIARNGAVLGVAVAIACGIVLGIFVGMGVTPRNPCGGDLPRETRQAATLVLTLGDPYRTRIEGPGECRRAAAGEDVREVVSDIGASAAWLVDNGAVRVEMEAYPAGGSPYPGANFLRLFLDDRAAGGFGIYGDGPAASVDVATGDGSSGRISFTTLPPWSDNAPGAGLPAFISGVLEWTCLGPESAGAWRVP